MSIMHLIIFFPLIGSLILGFFGNFFSRFFSALIGNILVFFSFFLSCFLSYVFLNSTNKELIVKLWNWVNINNFKIECNLLLDNLSLIMILLITGVGSLINLFSIWYIKKNKDYYRFFFYTNLFITNMVILVLSNNIILMYLGWEGVGLCSYLLISFYYKKSKNIYCAMKSFIMTRIGDIFLILSFIMIYYNFNTLSFHDISKLNFNSIDKIKNINVLYLINIFLLLGSSSKSAQIPIHTWLTDAMVGPTTASALIHAATMVTAGVYLLLRTKYLLLLTPSLMFLLSITSIITILISSLFALFKKNIKKILAYSTISQLGYMFLSISIGSYNTAIFHLVTHAFFKALLFLSSGSIILSCNGEKNIYKMGGLKKILLSEYLFFLIGSLSLVSFPFITSSFYSKGLILFNIFQKNVYLFLFSILGAFITVLYTCRMFFLIFYNKPKIGNIKIIKKNVNYYLPLSFLSFFSIIIGKIVELIFNKNFFIQKINDKNNLILIFIEIIILFFGILISINIWTNKKKFYQKQNMNIIFLKIKNFFLNILNLDKIYKLIFVNNYFHIIFFLKKYSRDYLSKLIFLFVCLSKKILLKLQNVYLNWYILSIIISSFLFILTIILY
ncbi:NADH-quinone oxidoreductase subunit L [Buchnera aphidicola (Taiwanaphis decaspermi)]|uniref:NADH-quinone oxidoreductase subunit L n=1 Tax=Buchnera aphidicola TaxID=9 RepID=UPI0031B87147